MNPVAMLRHVSDGEKRYDALMFCCPGCAGDGGTGLHMLPVNATDSAGRPKWTWDGNLEAPTLDPSILTRWGPSEKNNVCHSYLRNGVIEFLDDCTHVYAGQHVPLSPLPDWVVHESDEEEE